MSSLGHRVFCKHLARMGQLFIAAVLFGTAFSQQASAQIVYFGNPTQLVDNDANQGSPTLVNFVNLEELLYYVNHSNNTIYVDIGYPFGNPQSTGIVVWNAELTDVGAAVIYPCGSSTCPTVLLSYVATDQNVSFVTSTNGVNFGPRVVPPTNSLAIGNQNPDPALVPAVTSLNQVGQPAYVATVGADHFVYISTTLDGQTFTPLNGDGVNVSPYPTVSRPSLAPWNFPNNPYPLVPLVGFTTNGPGPQCRSGCTRAAIVQSAAQPGTDGMTRTDISWGNNNRSGNYAGIGLITANYDHDGGYDGYIYVFGQDTASSQYLKYMYNIQICNCGWTGAFGTGNQMRWTPSLINAQDSFWLAYQDDGNTNISLRFQSNPN